MYRWCRGKVLELTEQGADIFFVDTGEQEYLPVEDLRPLINAFLRLPFQAIECGLSHIKPYGQSPHFFSCLSDASTVSDPFICMN